MNIAGLVKTSTIDYSDKIACVVFTAGCNYDCWYCHNRMLLSNPPLFDEDEFFSFLNKRINMLEGVVISGGEPTQQKDLSSFAEKIKRIGYSVKLDTNGSNPEALSYLLQNSLIDYVAVDYKAPFDKYFDICKHNATGIQESVNILRTASIQWEMRTTVIPQLDLNDLIIMARSLPKLPLYVLQKYRPVHDEKSDSIYTTVKINEFANVLRKYQPNTIIRN